MAVEFRFEKLCITDFRGIHELELEFPDGFPLHLIGSNNAGKSTVLQAIALALRGGGFHQYDLAPFDFFKSATGEHARTFEVWLGPPTPPKNTRPPAPETAQPPSLRAFWPPAKKRKNTTAKKSVHPRRSPAHPHKLRP